MRHLREYHHFLVSLSCSIVFLSLLVTAEEDPLYLTPLLDEDKITEARELSEVRDPDQIIPESYAGFITADKVLGNHLFFWFFPSSCGMETPLLVWLNGGPGISSMLGMAWENGPIRVQKADSGNGTYEKWEKSWTQKFSMLYIDNPVEVGYSFTESGEDGYRTTQDGYSGDLYSFIEQFYVMFPEYLDQELYIGGQSYAGRYVPAFAYRIHQEITAGRSSIPLSGIYLGGPYFDPQTESEAFSEYYYSMGAITYPQMAKAKKEVVEFFESVNESKLDLNYSTVMQILFPELNVPGMRDNYVTLEIPNYIAVQKFMTSETTRKLIHAGKDLKFNIVNLKLQQEFIQDLLVSTKSKLAELMNNYKVLIFTGDLDGLVTSVMVDRALASTPWSLQTQYNSCTRSSWHQKGQFMKHLGFYNHDLRGFYNYVGQFCRVVIRGAGHHVPYDMPDVSLEMMLRFVQDGCVGRSWCQNPTVSGVIDSGTRVRPYPYFSLFVLCVVLFVHHAF